MQELSFVNRLEQSGDRLSRKEKAIANYLLEHKTQINDLNITSISKATGTSNATVSRLFTKLNYNSFGELKAMVSREDTVESLPSDTVDIIATYYKQMINSSLELIDMKQVTSLVNAIKEARQVMICGIGNSGLSATELKYRLTRMGIFADTLTDPHMSLMRTSLLNKEDVLIVLSHTGKTKAVLDTCEVAKERHIPIYAVTTHTHTPLTEIADVILFASKNSVVRDEKFINSQLVTQFVFDIVCYMLLEDQDFLKNRRQTIDFVNRD